MPEKKPSVAEPVTALRKVPIIECGEPLVDFREACPDLLIDKPRFDYRRETLARKSLAEKLCQANAMLPAGYRIAIIECWRPPHIQRRMYRTSWARFKANNPAWSDAHLRRVVNQFTAPMDPNVPPPHTTGGAVDLSLVDESGVPFDVHTPFPQREPRGFLFAAKGLSDIARRNRDILATALLSVGVTNYPSEYWHWSYGDQGWAYRGGQAAALYGAITPDGWSPEPGDDVDANLDYIFGRNDA